jgi:hypothetical protein
VLFNLGLCLICLEQVDKGLQDLRSAKEVKVTKDHDIIEKAIRRRGRGYTVFSIVRCFTPPASMLFSSSLVSIQPRGICYRPSEKKLANVSSRDYMGEAVRFHLIHPNILFLFESSAETYRSLRRSRHHDRFLRRRAVETDSERKHGPASARCECAGA